MRTTDEIFGPAQIFGPAEARRILALDYAVMLSSLTAQATDVVEMATAFEQYLRGVVSPVQAAQQFMQAVPPRAVTPVSSSGTGSTAAVATSSTYRIASGDEGEPPAGVVSRVPVPDDGPAAPAVVIPPVRDGG